MEPAEYRPDDDDTGFRPEHHRAAAMEPAEYRPDDVKTGQRRSCGQRAAMEPAEYRPDDAPRGASSALSWNGPQWSRPSIGRMTVDVHHHGEFRAGAAMEPAEYRPDDRGALPEEGGQVPAAMEPAEYRPDDKSGVVWLRRRKWPQWSRPSIGRMTADRACVQIG